MFKDWLSTIEKMSLVEKSYLSQIISPTFVMLTIVVSIAIYIGQKKKDRKESSIKIGDDLERLSEYMAYIHMVIQSENPEVYDIVSNTNPFKLKHFTYEEMLSVYTASELEKMDRIFKPIHYPNIDDIYNIKLEVLKKSRERFYFLFNTAIEDIKVDNLHDVLQHEFYRVVLSTMNRWTTFCISMTEGVALENLIFKCMGKNFVEFITVSYGFIANLNQDVDAVTKKMKFIVKIYNKWKKKLWWYNFRCKIKNNIMHPVKFMQNTVFSKISNWINWQKKEERILEDLLKIIDFESMAYQSSALYENNEKVLQKIKYEIVRYFKH